MKTDENYEKLKLLEEKIDCSPSKEIGTDEAWCKIKNLPALYENVVKERNALKAQLCKMSCVEELLKKLKKRADEADELEDQVCCLKREIQRSANGGAGDKSSKCQMESACNQCQQYSSKLCQTNSMLDDEIKKCNKIQAEINFLKARVRSIDVMEAELILYKVNIKFRNQNFTI